MTLSERGLNLIKEFEEFRGMPYRDAAGIPTIGYGATYYPDGQVVRMTDPAITEPEGSRMLVLMVARYADGISRYVQVPLMQEQFDALVSWAYNVGLEAARTSTLMRVLNAGDYAAAAAQFERWNRSGGQVLGGLTRRRRRERDLFLSGTEAETLA